MESGLDPPWPDSVQRPGDHAPVNPMLEGFLVVVLAAFGAYFIDDGEPWAGAAFVFASGALFGMGIVLWKPWAFLRRRRR